MLSSADMLVQSFPKLAMAGPIRMRLMAAPAPTPPPHALSPLQILGLRVGDGFARTKDAMPQ